MYALKMVAIYLTNLAALLSWRLPGHQNLLHEILATFGFQVTVSNFWLGAFGLATFALAYGINLKDQYRRQDNLAFERATKVLANLIVLGFFMSLFSGL